MTATGCYFMAHILRKNGSVIWSNLTGKISAECCDAANRNIDSSTTRHKGCPDRKEWNKKKREKSALEATISELNIKRFKIEASILAIVTDGSSGVSTISSLGGNRQAGNAFGGSAEKSQIKKK